MDHQTHEHPRGDGGCPSAGHVRFSLGEGCGCGPAPAQAEAGSCKRYVSPEEEAVLRTMRALRAEAVPLRRRLAERERILPEQERRQLQDRLGILRRRFQRARLELRRANHAKLRALGHEP